MLFAIPWAAKAMQFSRGCQCIPRLDFAEWTKLELGFPSYSDELINAYEDGHEGVYPFVPIELVEKLIEKHGGLKPSNAGQSRKAEPDMQLEGRAKNY